MQLLLSETVLEAGDRAFFMSDAMKGSAPDTTIYTSPTIDTATGEIFIKFVNAEAVDKRITVNTGSGTRYEAEMEFISSHDTSLKNQKEQNYYSSHPDYNKDPMDNVPPGMKERPGMRKWHGALPRECHITKRWFPTQPISARLRASLNSPCLKIRSESYA